MRSPFWDIGPLSDDLTNTTSSINRPAKESKQTDRHDNRLVVDDLAEFVDWHKSACQTDHPRNGESNQSATGHGDIRSKRIVNLGNTLGPRQDHGIDTIATVYQANVLSDLFFSSSGHCSKSEK